MNRTFSVYLDLVRFSAACLVYLSHSNQRWLVQDILPASRYAHSAVIVFFVLSGFVIAYVTEVKEREWRDYAAARLSRVYSVALPAVLLTLLLDTIGRSLNPGVYDYPYDQFATRVAGSLLFANETWFVSMLAFSNVPYWSVCYEVWYYVFFGLLVFAPRKPALVLMAGLALLLGPKIVLLAPVWILGVVLYRWRALRSLSPAVSWLLLVSSTAGIIVYSATDFMLMVERHAMVLFGREPYRSLVWSRHFLSDYVLGFLVFAHFAGMRGVADHFGPVLLRFEKPIRWLASYTFSLYLLHYPLFLFWASVIRGDPSTHLYWALTTLAVGASVVAIGLLTEQKRYVLTHWLRERLGALGRKRSAGVHGH